MIFYVEFIKKLNIFSLFTSAPSPPPHTPDFLFEISVISIVELLFKGGEVNSVKWLYVEGVVHVKQTRRNKRGGRGSKTGIFERIYFLNDPLGTNNGHIYVKSMGNYEQTSSVIKKNKVKNENRESINFLISWFYLLNFSSDKA